MTGLLRLPRVDSLLRVLPAPKTSTKFMLRALVERIICAASWRKLTPSSLVHWQRRRSSPRSRPGQM
jgi:hypothetical protein